MTKALIGFLFFPLIAAAGDPVKGREIVLAPGDGNCLLCHSVPGADRPAGNIGPSLAGVGSRFDEKQLRLRLVDASRFNPGTIMPPYGSVENLYSVAPQYRGKPLLTDEQIGDAAAFLATLQEAGPPLSPRNGASGEELRRLQASDAENPGMLWVDRGAKLWRENCASCHKDVSSMKGVAARYPKRAGGKVVSLEEKIRQKVPFGYESDDLLGITAYVAMQSRGMPLGSDVGEKDLEKGNSEYYRRRGQMNLSCAHCHEANWGKHLGAETVSQGHGNGYPAYRLEWQKMGSLQRRLRACMFGVHAELPPFGSETLLELELFLARRAHGFAVETPAVRR